MRFGQAIRTLNAGKRIRREHWPKNASVSLYLSKFVANMPNGSKAEWVPEAADVEADDWSEAPPFDPELASRRHHLLPEEQ